MPLSFDIHENEFLEEIFQDGMQAGRLNTARQLLIELLETKFGAIPAAVKDRIRSLSFEEIQACHRKTLTADSPEKVFVS